MKIKHRKEKHLGLWKYFFLGGILLFFLVFASISTLLKEKLEAILLPVQAYIYQSKESIAERFQSHRSKEELSEENKKIKQELQVLDYLRIENKSLKDENRRLTELLDLKASLPKNTYFAKVYFRKPENMYDQFYIDRGKEDGLEQNMIIMQGESLIGRISNVEKERALVSMLTKDGMAVSARTESHMYGIVKGIGEERLYFEPNIYDDSLKLGDKLYTSGISDIYPEGIYIGYVCELEKGDNSLFTSIAVKPSMNIVDLKEVLIIPKRRDYE